MSEEAVGRVGELAIIGEMVSSVCWAAGVVGVAWAFAWMLKNV